MRSLSWILLLALMITACGKKDFSSNPKKQTSSQTADTTADTPEGEPAMGTPESNAAADSAATGSEEFIPLTPEDQSTIGECQKQWTTPPPPFSAGQLAQPTIVNVDQANSNNAPLFEDTKVTAEPKLFLVNLNVQIGNQGHVSLQNTKGWYCLNIKAKVINNFRIDVACGAQVAVLTKDAQNDNKFTIVRETPCP